MKFIRKSLLVTTIILFSTPLFLLPKPPVYAGEGFSISDVFCLQTDATGNCKETVAGNFPSITDIISKAILPNALLVAGIILLFLFMFGGVTIITNSGNPEKTQKGSQAITGAIIGFVIIFMAYWIIQIIEVLTGIPILNPGI